MADQLYLSLWFPNFRLDALPAALVSVLRQFATVSGDKRVAAASAYPLGFTESPTWQRIYVNDPRAEDTSESSIENAVAEATEQLHDDMAYEFEMRWPLWSPVLEDSPEGLETTWKELPSTVRVLGFGPEFDDASFDQNGHIRVDFGLDTPWLLEDAELDDAAAVHIQKNVEMLLAFTLLVEKHCALSSRLLWTESGEPLAQKLIGRLQRVH
jgi:hypothetical protein